MCVVECSKRVHTRIGITNLATKTYQEFVKKEREGKKKRTQRFNMFKYLGQNLYKQTKWYTKLQKQPTFPPF